MRPRITHASGDMVARQFCDRRCGLPTAPALLFYEQHASRPPGWKHRADASGGIGTWRYE
jgi:hypothetical protein